MFWMAVVVADDVQARGVCFTLDPDVVARVDLVAVSRALDDDVARASHLCDSAVAGRTDHDPADLAWVPLGPMGPDRVKRGGRDFHALKTREPAGLGYVGRVASNCQTRLASCATICQPAAESGAVEQMVSTYAPCGPLTTSAASFKPRVRTPTLWKTGPFGVPAGIPCS